MPKRGRKRLVCPDTVVSLLGVVPDAVIAAQAGVSVGTARRWRVMRGLDPCPRTDRLDGRRSTLGKEAYELRSGGVPWYDVGVQLLRDKPALTAENTVTVAASRYARRHGLPWPLRMVEMRAEVRIEDGRRFYERAFCGMKRADIAKDASVSVSYVAHCIQLYVRAYPTVPWPIPQSRNPRLAYDLRVQGQSWATIQQLTGYKHRTHVIGAARALSLIHI